MSGFLQHLAARSFRGSSALRPKLPSLFEGKQKGPGASPEEKETDTRTEYADAEDAGAQAKMKAAPQRFAAAAPPVSYVAPALPSSTVVAPSEPYAPGRNESPRDQAAAKEGVGAGAQARPVPRGARDAAAKAPSPASPGPVLQPERIVEIRREVDRGVLEHAPLAALRIALPAALPPLAPEAQSAPPQTSSSPVRLREERQPKPPSAEGTVGTLQPKRSFDFEQRLANASLFPRTGERSGRGRGEDLHGAPAAEPSVHISIGRIEIVAETASSPARRPSQHEPTHGITLEDYLRRESARANA